jgi:hypothetical protein
MMTKHAQNRKRFGRRNFKQRYFRLTTQSLSYAKSKGKRPICDIPLTELVAVERLEEKNFKLQNIIRVSFKDFFALNTLSLVTKKILTLWICKTSSTYTQLAASLVFFLRLIYGHSCGIEK